MSDERVSIDASDLGRLVSLAIDKGLSSHEHFSRPAMELARKYWPQLDSYWHRKIIFDVQVAILLESASTGEATFEEDGTIIQRKKLRNKAEWQRFADDLEPPKAEHSIDYHCHKCKTREVKLWREIHSGARLLCAACLSPEQVVGDDGRIEDDGVRHDQLAGWLPACPVGDSFWGYTSVPSADVRWWKSLATYAPGQRKKVVRRAARKAKKGAA